MTPIITPTLVRRYLLAMGYRRVPWGWTRRKPGLHEWTATEAGFHHVDDLVTLIERAAADGGGIAHELCARLGMLAAAEKLRAAFEANWAPGEEEGVEHFVRGEIRGYILAAGLTPEAWEEAKQHD